MKKFLMITMMIIGYTLNAYAYCGLEPLCPYGMTPVCICDEDYNCGYICMGQ